MYVLLFLAESKTRITISLISLYKNRGEEELDKGGTLLLSGAGSLRGTLVYQCSGPQFTHR